MLRSLYSGVSGAKTHQAKMDVIGNNIANVNTTAFKTGKASFQEVMAQTIRSGYGPTDGRGSINPIQIGLGSSLRNVENIFTPGNIENTGRFTDVAIDGNGFFILRDGTHKVYTRDGHFDIGPGGVFETTSSGAKVQGWMAKDVNQDGRYDVNEIQQSNAPSDLIFGVGTEQIKKATTKVEMTGNLDASLKVSKNVTTSDDTGTVKVGVLSGNVMGNSEVVVEVTGVDGAGYASSVTFKIGEKTYVGTPDPAYDPTDPSSHVQYFTLDDGTDASPAEVPPDPADDFVGDTGANALRFTPKSTAIQGDIHSFSLPTYSTSMTVYDDLGIEHPLNVTFTKAESPDKEWSFRIDVPTGVIGSFPGSPSPGNAIYGKIRFNEDSVTHSWTAVPILVEPSGGTLQNVAFDPGNSLGVQPLNLDFSSLTLLAASSTVKMGSQDGYPVGILESFSVGPQGYIIGNYTNEQTRLLGQIAIANFANPAGLLKAGDSSYAETLSSGPAQIGGADSEGRGTIRSMSLEMSNVDLSQEFTDMIVTQRGFQANTRVITTSDELLQELMGIKR